MITIMSLFEFLNQQSGMRLLGYGVLLLLIIIVFVGGIIDIVNQFKK